MLEVVEEEQLGPCNPEVSSPPPEIVSARFYNTQTRAVLEKNWQHMMETQRQDVVGLLDTYPML